MNYDIAIHEPRKLARNREAKPNSTEFAGCSAICLLEFFKSLSGAISGNAYSSIDNVHFHAITRLGFTHIYLKRNAALRCKFDRVPNYVEQNLPNTSAVAKHVLRENFILNDVQIDALARRLGAKLFDGIVKKTIEIELPWLHRKVPRIKF